MLRLPTSGWQNASLLGLQFQAERQERTSDKLRVRKMKGLSKQRGDLVGEALLVARDTLSGTHLRSHQAAISAAVTYQLVKGNCNDALISQAAAKVCDL